MHNIALFPPPSPPFSPPFPLFFSKKYTMFCKRRMGDTHGHECGWIKALHRQNSCVPTTYVTHDICMLCPQHVPTVFQVCTCRGYILWRTTYAVGHMPWGTMSMLPTPYVYGVGNTYSVDDVLYAVGTYSVGDMPWASRPYTVGYICCGYMPWASRPYAVGNICCGYIPWTT